LPDFRQQARQQENWMLAVRFHGRGGQGAVIASKLLATALFREGWQVQAFPSFGAERSGAPVAAFLRADHQRISDHSYIYKPDHVVVLDPILIQSVDVAAGLAPGGTILVNSSRPPESLGLPAAFAVVTCDATAIALKHELGTRTTPIVNTAMAGAFAALTGLVGVEELMAAVRDLVPTKAESNQAAAREAFDAIARAAVAG
jgi:2-oxoacid:acceptor oxidoreductase gamma subunit (pyruvate/2-ketoisovalerate family)